ncbi:MAG: hypothetical protein ABSH34_26725 [Verrucomicrobiota bacterium]
MHHSQTFKLALDMIRIEHDPRLDAVCIFWRDLDRPFFHAQMRPVSAIPLYLGTVYLGGRDEHQATRVAAVLSTTQGEPDWRRGLGVVFCGTELDESVFNVMLKAIDLAVREGLVDTGAADQARREILDMSAIRN